MIYAFILRLPVCILKIFEAINSSNVASFNGTDATDPLKRKASENDLGMAPAAKMSFGSSQVNNYYYWVLQRLEKYYDLFFSWLVTQSIPLQHLLSTIRMLLKAVNQILQLHPLVLCLEMQIRWEIFWYDWTIKLMKDSCFYRRIPWLLAASTSMHLALNPPYQTSILVKIRWLFNILVSWKWWTTCKFLTFLFI